MVAKHRAVESLGFRFANTGEMYLESNSGKVRHWFSESGKSKSIHILNIVRYTDRPFTDADVRTFPSGIRRPVLAPSPEVQPSESRTTHENKATVSVKTSRPSMKSATRNNPISFVIHWQAANTIQEAAEASGLTVDAATQYADHLRKLGVKLRRVDEFVDVEALNRMIDGARPTPYGTVRVQDDRTITLD